MVSDTYPIFDSQCINSHILDSPNVEYPMLFLSPWRFCPDALSLNVFYPWDHIPFMTNSSSSELRILYTYTYKFSIVDVTISKLFLGLAVGLSVFFVLIISGAVLAYFCFIKGHTISHLISCTVHRSLKSSPLF